MPLVPAAIGLSVGIVIDDRYALHPVAPLAVGIVALCLIALSRRSAKTFSSFSNHAHHLVLLSPLLAAAALGMLRNAISDRYLPASHIAHYLASEPMIVSIEGEIVTAPYIREPDPDVPTAFPRSPSTRFNLSVQSLSGNDGPIPVSGLVSVNVRAPRLDLSVGQHVAMTGWIYRPKGPSNPDDFDWAHYMRREGVFAGFSCDHGESVRVTDGTGPGASAASRFELVLIAARQRLRGYLIDDVFEQDDQASGVLSAIILGHRSAVSQAMNEAFLRTGNAHLLAASGMQVAWLAMVVWIIARSAGVYYRHIALLVGVVIISYVLIAEPRPSILRAGIVGVLACAAAFFRGRYYSANALATAAIIILLLRPGDLFSAAFQLTFLATIGLIFFCPLVSERIAEFLINRNMAGMARAFSMAPFPLTLISTHPEKPSRFRRVFRWSGVAIAQLFALSLSEWVLTAPLSCYLFNNFMPLGWLGTFLVSFLAIPANILGYLMVLARLAFPTAGIVVGPLLGISTNAMLATVETLSHIPGSVVSGRSPSVIWVLSCYAVIGLWCYRRHVKAAAEIESMAIQSTASGKSQVIWRHATKAAVLILAFWWLIPPAWAIRDRGTLNVWMMAVGDGTGTIIELPDGRTIIYDFGTRSSFDAKPVALNFLKRRGIDRLDAVFVSHPDFDHLSALERLSHEVEFARVILNDQFERFAEDESAARRFVNAMNRRGIPVEIVTAPHTFDEFAPATLEQLWPPPVSQRRLASANDTSTVLKLTYQSKSILLTGDITETAMAGLIDLEYARADVLALPHHGSVVGNTKEFIERVNPHVAIRSSGQRRALTTNGIEQLVGNRSYYCTADDGCIRSCIQNGELTVDSTLPQSSTDSDRPQ